MINNGHKTIGIFISEVDSEYPGRLSRGIAAEAKALGYNAAFFTNYSGYGQDAYDGGEIFVTDIPNLDLLDGLILADDTMHSDALIAKVQNEIAVKAKCPVVSVRHPLPSSYNVLIDDNTVLEEIITHFIEKHHFTRLAFLAGPKDFPDSENRLICFRRIMEAHGLPVTEENIFYGDFWKIKPYEAVEYFLSPGKVWPEAIICANDYMALTVCNALIDRGIRVPEDIAVSGNDDISSASQYTPSLTTAGIPIEEMGTTAVDIIDSLLNGHPVEQNTYLYTYTIYRESCGCGSTRSNQNSVGRHLMQRLDTMRAAYRGNAIMSNSFIGMSSLEAVCDKLEYHVYDIPDFANFYMCLCDDWLKINRPCGYSEIMQLAYHHNRYPVQDYSHTPMTSFLRGELLPDGVAPAEATIFFFNVLHHHEKVYGYTVLCFNQNITYSTSYEGWLINLGNALENVRTSVEMNRLVSELARTYTVDMLTGLYNRRGLEVLSKELLSTKHAPGDRLMVFCADMDDLKAVNDNFGHTSGDVAIRAISDALKRAAVDDYLCARCGGDEFTVVGILRSDKDPSAYAKRVSARIDDFNRSSRLPWMLHVSFGWHVMLVEGLDDIEEGMTLADGQLYKEKAMNKARRLIENLESRK